jgi:hypothetical protein
MRWQVFSLMRFYVFLHGSNVCTGFEITDDQPHPDGPTSTAQEGERGTQSPWLAAPLK